MLKRFIKIVIQIKKKIVWLIIGETPQEQLELIYNRGCSKERIKVPDGYSLKTYKSQYKERLLSLYKNVGLIDDPLDLENALHLAVPDGVILLFHDNTNAIVAAFMARHISNNRYPCGGRLDWLAVDPGHRSQKLGYIVTCKAIDRLYEIGYQKIYVTTDDFRVPAIKTFMNAGMVPNIYSDGMDERWQQVIRGMND
jgi:mycothiol synthase